MNEVIRFIAFGGFTVSLVLLSLIDSIIIRLIWQLKPEWAENQQIPRKTGDRPRAFNWTKRVMTFDQQLQFTPRLKKLSLASGIIHYFLFTNILLMLLCYLFQTRTS